MTSARSERGVIFVVKMGILLNSNVITRVFCFI